MQKEILIMREMKHSNVVPIKCAFVEEEELWVVMPLLAGGGFDLSARFDRQMKHMGLASGVLNLYLFERLLCPLDEKIIPQWNQG